MMRKSQSGFSLISMTLVALFMAAVVLVFLRIVPVISEYLAIKQAIGATVASADPATATVSQLRLAFTKRAELADVTSVHASDLDISKEDGGHIVISVDYSRKVPLVSNVSLLIDFSVTSTPSH